MKRHLLRSVSLFLALVLFLSPTAYSQTDPLPSWNDTAPKKSILAFVEKVTKEGAPDFVAPADRIATFDNDGTLWGEQPMYVQMRFAFDRVKQPLHSIRNGRRHSRSKVFWKAT
jgi:hypothetical protein